MKNYVKEYKGYKVPKGATHYGNSHPVAYFYKFNAVKIPFFYLNHEWKRSSACDVYIKDNLTELPEAPQDWDGEGLPPVGTLCTISADGFEYLFSAASNELSSITENTELVVVGHCTRHDNGAECVTLMARDSRDARGFTTVNPEFITPLKTQQEKDREALFQYMRELQPVSTPAMNDVLDHYTHSLIDAGVTTPKATDNDQK